MIDVVIGVVLLMINVSLVSFAANAANRARRTIKEARQGGPRVRPRYEWEPITDRYYRRAKGVRAPAEDRDGILEFIGSRSGVEAYIEPRTVMHPLSVALARSRGVPVFDATRTGYPERMRRRPGAPPGGTEEGRSP